MTYSENTCPSFSVIQRQELWQRWRQGESIAAIARVLGKQAPSVRYFLSIHGGITPVPRCRANITLTLNERETISRGLRVRRCRCLTKRSIVVYTYKHVVL